MYFPATGIYFLRCQLYCCEAPYVYEYERKTLNDYAEPFPSNPCNTLLLHHTTQPYFITPYIKAYADYIIHQKKNKFQ